MNRKHTISVAFLGRTEYRECWDLQKTLFDRRLRGSIDDTLLITEHDPVYTLGRGGNPHHLLVPLDELAAMGATFVMTDRGGDITYHGPGQLVAYPIVDLNDYGRDLHQYLRRLEEVVIRVLEQYEVNGRRQNGWTGVWVEEEKICAIGVKTSRWVTMHGLAMNVSTDLSWFDTIVPCGIVDKKVTSLSAVTGMKVTPDEIIPAFLQEFGEVFDATMIGQPGELPPPHMNAAAVGLRDNELMGSHGED